jgi:hypothetical protein
VPSGDINRLIMIMMIKKTLNVAFGKQIVVKLQSALGVNDFSDVKYLVLP